MDECVRNVQSACSALGVTFLESDINRDGGKFLLVAGAPRSSGEDDDRLISAVRLVMTRQGRLPLRAGANHGRVFAGDFGPDFRRTYSIKGDAINVAARVMGHAEPGTLLATDEVLTRAGGRFETRPVPPFLVKGKAKPIHAAEVGAVQAARSARWRQRRRVRRARGGAGDRPPRPRRRRDPDKGPWSRWSVSRAWGRAG